MTQRALAVFPLALLIAACSGSDTTTPAAGASSSSSSGSSGATSSSGDPPAEQPAGAGAPFKAYVILGDSISDKGGSGPFFYDLVGEELKGKLGEVQVVKASKSGAVSAQLPTQVKSLPTSLPGPVAISVTIGGNDMQRAAIAILQGNDAKDRAAFAANLTKAYDELTTEGRFGAGVKATIFHSTVYDPSDGAGDFAESGCPGYLAAIPKQPTKGFWDNWNAAADEVTKKYGAAVVTVQTRKTFEGHGVSHLKDGTSWYAPDCIHPNTAGHAELSKLFFAAIAP